MSYKSKILYGQFNPPDTADKRFAFLISGGTKAVSQASHRHTKWKGMDILALSVFCIFLVTILYEWPVGLVFLMIAITSWSIFLLAQDSLFEQIKAKKTSSSVDDSNHFLTKMWLLSCRFLKFYVLFFLILSRAISLKALQRLFDNFSGMVHPALTNRLLPTPIFSR